MFKDNSQKRLLEVMHRLDARDKSKLNENIHNTAMMGGILNSKGTAGYDPDASNRAYQDNLRYNNSRNPNIQGTTVKEPIIPDAIAAIQTNPKAKVFGNKQSYDDFANQQQYFSASHSHCFYSPEERQEWSKNGSKYTDQDSEQSDMVFETGHELVQVWDNKNNRGYVVPSERKKENAVDEVFGWSAKEKEGKANQQLIDAAKQEVGKYNFNRVFFIPAKKDGKFVDIERSKEVRINGIKQELPMLAQLIPQLFDLKQGTASMMMPSAPNRYEGLIPSNWYSYLRGNDGYISNEKAIETLNRELDGIGQKMGVKEVQLNEAQDKGKEIVYTFNTKAQTEELKYRDRGEKVYEHPVHIIKGERLRDDKFNGLILSIQDTPGSWYLETLVDGYGGRPSALNYNEMAIDGGAKWYCTNWSEIAAELKQWLAERDKGSELDEGTKTHKRLLEVMHKLDARDKSKLNEDISIDVEVGDVIMTGRFKNSPTVVKKIEKDEHGMPTINGKKVVTFRKASEKT